MLEQHKSSDVMVSQQVENSATYVLPFIEQTLPIIKGLNVLEIGCGEGGVLRPFLEKGCQCLGVDLDSPRLAIGAKFLKEFLDNGQLEFSDQNVYDEDFVLKYQHHFDLIILKDVIEHVPEQEKFIPHLKKLLTPKGQIFFGFPPWYMPFGGHQQVLPNKLASKFPYYHILPMPLFIGLVKMSGASDGHVELMRITKETGITIERFERIVRQNNFTIKSKQWFLFNPIYKFKFGLQPRKQNWLFGAVPFVRNFLTTCAYYVIQPNN